MTKDEIFKFIDSEMAQRRSNSERLGLTEWALWVGIASLSWILVGLLEKVDGSLLFNLLTSRSVFFIIFFLTILLNFLESLSSLIYSVNFSMPKLVNLSTFQREAIKDFIESFLIIFLFYKIDFSSLPYSILVYGYLGPFLLMPFIVRKLPLLPVHKVLEKKVGNMTAAPFFHIVCRSLIFSFSLFWAYATGPHIINANELKIGLIIFGITRLVLELVDVKGPNPIVDHLVESKRRLMFGEIEETDAERSIRIYMDSAKLSDYFREKISSILTRQYAAISFIKEINFELSKYFKISDEEFERETGKKMEDYKREINVRLEKFSTNIKNTYKDFDALKIKLRFFVRINSDLESDANETLKPIDEMTKRIMEEHEKLKITIEEMKKKKRDK